MIVWPEQFPLCAIMCEIILIESSLVSGNRKSTSKMSNFVGKLPLKFIGFRHSVFESSARKLPEEQGAEKPRVDELDTVVVDETSNSTAKILSVLQNAPISVENVTSGMVERDIDLIMAENDCVMTRSEEDVEDVNAFVSDNLQFLSERGLAQFEGDESPNRD